VYENEHVDDPAVTGTVNDPLAVGVPLAVSVTVCVPVVEKLPETLNVTPLTADVTME
jgi:hypothetical protein